MTSESTTIQITLSRIGLNSFGAQASEQFPSNEIENESWNKNSTLKEHVKSIEMKKE